MIPISICIITKNEEKFLGNCLRAIRKSLEVPVGCMPIPHEIVVTDTGSTDRTREIALQYADKVADFKWINDFAAARNFCISQASHEYILNIDSDEYIEEADWYAIDELLKKSPKCVGNIMLNNDQTLNGTHTFFSSRLERFFPRSCYHFVNKVHEQIRPLPDYIEAIHPGITPLEIDRFIKENTLCLPLTARHVGYQGDEAYLRAKCERDLQLLLKELAENPVNAYNLFQAGQCYHMLDEDEKAIQFYEKALLFDLNPKMDYVKVLVSAYGYCLLHLERYEEALGLEAIYNDFATNADFVILMGLIYAHNKLYIKALAEFVKALSFSDSETFIQSSNKQIAHYNIGYIYEVFGEKEMAIKQYQMCGDYPMALARLKELT